MFADTWLWLTLSHLFSGSPLLYNTSTCPKHRESDADGRCLIPWHPSCGQRLTAKNRTNMYQIQCSLHCYVCTTVQVIMYTSKPLRFPLSLSLSRSKNSLLFMERNVNGRRMKLPILMLKRSSSDAIARKTWHAITERK